MAPPPTNSPVTDSPGMGSTSAFRARGTTAPSRAPEQAPPAVEPSAPATRPAAATVVTAAAPKTKGKRRRLLFLVPILLVALAVGLTYAYRYWYEATYFVSTDNASVTGDLVQVGSLNAGRIVATRVATARPSSWSSELSVVSGQSSAISGQLSAISGQLSVIRMEPSATGDPGATDQNSSLTTDH